MAGAAEEELLAAAPNEKPEDPPVGLLTSPNLNGVAAAAEPLLSLDPLPNVNPPGLAPVVLEEPKLKVPAAGAAAAVVEASAFLGAAKENVAPEASDEAAAAGTGEDLLADPKENEAVAAAAAAAAPLEGLEFEPDPNANVEEAAAEAGGGLKVIVGEFSSLSSFAAEELGVFFSGVALAGDTAAPVFLVLYLASISTRCFS